MTVKRRLERLEASAQRSGKPNVPDRDREAEAQAHAERFARNVMGRVEGRLGAGEFEAGDLPLLTERDKEDIDRYAPVAKTMAAAAEAYRAAHGRWPGD